jgi:hypothetical protein
MTLTTHDLKGHAQDIWTGCKWTFYGCLGDEAQELTVCCSCQQHGYNTIDGKVKIWNMKTLADPNIDATTEPSKHLCTMSVHNGKSLFYALFDNDALAAT